MLGCLLAPLMNTLRPHFDLSKTRLATLSVLPVGLANCRTVHLSHLASQFPESALKCCAQHFRANRASLRTAPDHTTPRRTSSCLRIVLVRRFTDDGFLRRPPKTISGVNVADY